MKSFIAAASLLTLPLFAQVGGNSAYNAQLKKMEAEAEQKELAKAEKTVAARHTGMQEVMIIEPLTRAQDIEEAFKYLRTRKAAAPVTFYLNNGHTLSNVLDMAVMKGGSIFIFTVNSTKGIRYEVVKTEDIKTLGN